MDFELSRDGDTVDLIAWRRRGQTAEVSEKIFLLNPGLAAYGSTLPAGLRVRLPDPPAPKVLKGSKRLWS